MSHTVTQPLCGYIPRRDLEMQPVSLMQLTDLFRPVRLALLKFRLADWILVSTCPKCRESWLDRQKATLCVPSTPSPFALHFDCISMPCMPTVPGARKDMLSLTASLTASADSDTAVSHSIHRPCL